MWRHSSPSGCRSCGRIADPAHFGGLLEFGAAKTEQPALPLLERVPRQHVERSAFGVNGEFLGEGCHLVALTSFAAFRSITWIAPFLYSASFLDGTPWSSTYSHCSSGESAISLARSSSISANGFSWARLKIVTLGLVLGPPFFSGRLPAAEDCHAREVAVVDHLHTQPAGRKCRRGFIAGRVDNGDGPVLLGRVLLRWRLPYADTHQVPAVLTQRHVLGVPGQRNGLHQLAGRQIHHRQLAQARLEEIVRSVEPSFRTYRNRLAGSVSANEGSPSRGTSAATFRLSAATTATDGGLTFKT